MAKDKSIKIKLPKEERARQKQLLRIEKFLNRTIVRIEDTQKSLGKLLDALPAERGAELAPLVNDLIKAENTLRLVAMKEDVTIVEPAAPEVPRT